MMRLLAFSGLGMAFLMISPPMRETLMGWLTNGVHQLDQHSPVSYVALGIAGIGGFLVSLKTGSAPR